MSARQEMHNALMRERVVEHIEVLSAAVAAAETAGEDLIAFFNARLNEEWMVAKMATPGAWHATGEDIITRGSDAYTAGACIANASGADGEHIARHDPARALREVEAGRKLLDEYKRYRASAASQTEAYGQVGPGTWAVVRVLYRAIAFAASVHADHPDYRQEWKL